MWPEIPRHFSGASVTTQPSLPPHESYRAADGVPPQRAYFQLWRAHVSSVTAAPFAPPSPCRRRRPGPMSRPLRVAFDSLQTGHFIVKGSFEEQFSPPLQNSSEFKGPGDGFYVFPIGCKCGIGAALKILIFPDPFIMASPVRVERFTIFPNPIPSSQYAKHRRRYTAPVIMALLYRNHISIVVGPTGTMARRSGGDGDAGDTAPRGPPAAF